MINEQLLSEFEAFLGTQIPGFRVAYKTDSKLMRFFGFLLRPFNPLFLTEYITTWGSTVYFPSRESYTKDVVSTVATLSHEFVHLSDDREHGLLKFKGAYIAPQIFALIPLVLYAILGSLVSLGVLVGGYVLSSFLASKNRILGLVTLAVAVLGSLYVGWLFSGLWILLPTAAVAVLFLPSKGRTKWELRAYAMNIGLVRWLFNQQPAATYYDAIRQQFTGPSYFFMCWSRAHIEFSMDAAIRQAADGTLQQSGPYQKVYAFLDAHGLILR